jgi:hypothetical protein
MICRMLMRMSHEGVANCIDPESCADAREGIGEALTGERIGQPLSRESTLIPGADVQLGLDRLPYTSTRSISNLHPPM